VCNEVFLLLALEPCVILGLLQFTLLFLQAPVLHDKVLDFGGEFLYLSRETNFLLQAFCKKTNLWFPTALIHTNLK
jgi:hypothetical protein